MQIKRAPERWQETTKHFDIVITFDQRVYDMVVEGILLLLTLARSLSLYDPSLSHLTFREFSLFVRFRSRALIAC